LKKIRNEKKKRRWSKDFDKNCQQVQDLMNAIKNFVESKDKNNLRLVWLGKVSDCQMD